MNHAQAIAEQVETKQYALLLPAKSEELRQYLANDGLLSNEEITKALYDDSLTKKALREKVVAAEPAADKKLLDRLTNHLWDTHQSVKAAKHLLPAEGIDPTATYRLTITEGQTNRIEPQQQQSRSQEQEGAPMPKVVIVNGNLIANFLHNYRLNRDIQLKVEKLPQVQQARSQQPKPVQQPSVIAAQELKPKLEQMPSDASPADKPVTSPAVVKETTDTPRVPTQPANKVDPTTGVTTSTSARDKPYQWEQVASQLAAAGITRQQLAESGQLAQLLNGQQTGSVAFDQKIGNRYVSLTGKIRVVEVNGQPVVRMKPIRDPKITHSLSIPKQLRGYTFTPDDRASLLKTGELGKRVELIHPTTGQLHPAYIGADSKTRQLVITRQDQVKLPKSINGVTLTQTQRELIGEGKAVRLDGLTGQNGQTFSAFVQVSAAKRGLNLTSVPANSVKQTTDLKTAADLNRPSHELRGTPNSQSRATETTKAKKTRQTQRQEPAVADETSQRPRLR